MKTPQFDNLGLIIGHEPQNAHDLEDLYSISNKKKVGCGWGEIRYIAELGS